MKDMVVAQVRELLERHLEVYEIASRLKIDISLVQTIVDMLT